MIKERKFSLKYFNTDYISKYTCTCSYTCNKYMYKTALKVRLHVDICNMIKIIEELCMQTMTFLSKSLNQQAGAIINASIVKDDIIKSHQQRRDIYITVLPLVAEVPAVQHERAWMNSLLRFSPSGSGSLPLVPPPSKWLP